MKNSTRFQRVMTAVFAAALFTAVSCNKDAAAPGEGKVAHVDDSHTGHDHGAEGEHAEEITLSPEELKRAGVRTAKVGSGRVTQAIRLPARVAVNEDTIVHVNPPIGGIVLTVHKKVGEKVSKGDILAELNSVELGKMASDLLKAKADFDADRVALDNETKLFDERLLAQERLSNSAIAMAQQIYDREKDLVDKGLTLVRPLLDAEKELKTAGFLKESALTTLKAERATRLLVLSTALKSAEIDLEGARDRLRAVGLSAAAVSALAHNSDDSLGHIVLSVPRDGIVVERHLTIGEFVDTQTTLAVIQDLTKLWIFVSVNEKEIAKVNIGQRALIRVDAFPKTAIEGKVSFIDFRVDEATRSADARIEVDNVRLEGWNEDLPLRPGMFGIADLIVADRELPVVVPEAALVTQEGTTGVFVRDQDGGFVLRPVEVGITGAENVEITHGLKAGEDIAVAGTFVLKSLLNKEKMEHDH